jgi:toxin FitB
MRVLLDTCVLSELRRPSGSIAVRRAISDLPSPSLFVSVVTIGEIAKGVALLDDGERKRDLQGWLQTIENHYAERILPVDLETSRIWGELTAAARKSGKQVASADGLIAATARRRGLHLMTRNVSDFEPTGVMLINPWDNRSS